MDSVSNFKSTGCQGYPQCNAGIKVPDIVSDISVSLDRCDMCTQTPEDLCFKLKTKFIKSKVPYWISEEYLGCVGGCDGFFNEYFTHIRPNQMKRMPLSSLNQNSRTSQQQSRNFVAASTPQGCNRDNNTGPGVGSSGTSFTAGFTHQTDSGKEPPKCRCNLYAVLKKKLSQGENQGKEYYSCHKAGRGNCHFFQWVDDVSPRGNSSQSGFRRASESIDGNSGNGNACFNCGEIGHFSNVCRKPKKAKSNNADVICFKCQQPGHCAPQCPNGGTSQRGKRGSGARTRGVGRRGKKS